MNSSYEFHKEFDDISLDILSKVREDLLEGPGRVSREELLGQIIMNEFFAHPCDPEGGGLTPDVKAFLVRVAAHMGPDYCQGLYHAAVFMTKVV